MSTKVSIAYGENFHLYKECWDDDGVFLHLDNAHFEATPTGVTLKIPMHVWEYIRAFEAADLSGAHLSDEQIEQQAAQQVDARLTFAAAGDGRASLAALGGSLTMGDISLPREQQIANLVTYRKKQKAQKKAILDHVLELSKNDV